MPRSYDLAHLAHVELPTPHPEAGLDFFVRVMGLTVSAREGDGAYLRHLAELHCESRWYASFHTHGTPPATPQADGSAS